MSSIGEKVLSAEKLTKKYGSKTAVKELSLSLRTGDVLGFIGPNGAGKTTTMKMLCSIMPPTSGKVFVMGKDVSDDQERAKRYIGFLPENAPLPSSMTVEEFLFFAGAMRGAGKGRETREKVFLAAKRCGLESVWGEDLDALSKGYRRRVCLAQALVHEPEILILDEPTDGLDPNQKKEIRFLIRKLASDTAVIVSTHILEEVGQVCSRVLLLCGGSPVFDGTADKFLSLGSSPEETFCSLTGGNAEGEKA